MTTLHDFSATAIDGSDIDLSQYEGKAVLVVNTAPKCGFTPQYDGLEELYQRYADDGLVVLGFPCDQFGHQEPGDEDEIQEFCKVRFGVSFPLFSRWRSTARAPIRSTAGSARRSPGCSATASSGTSPSSSSPPTAPS